MASYYRIKNWEQYQHYKDRSPPWIKLHRNLLQSETWVMLSDAGRVLAIASMMIAADTENKIPANARYIRRLAYLDYDPDFAPLVECDFLEYVENQDVTDNPLADASAVLADASPEERRGEKRREEGAGKKSKDYAFQGKIIRIDQSQADAWRRNFPKVDLIPELTAADAYYVENPPKDGKWFFAVSNWLKRSNERAIEKQSPHKQSAPGKMDRAAVSALMGEPG